MEAAVRAAALPGGGGRGGGGAQPHQHRPRLKLPPVLATPAAPAPVGTCHHNDASYSLIGGSQTQVVIVTHKLFIHVRCYVQGQGLILTLLHFVKLRQKEG